MQKSESIKELAAALSIAQGLITGAAKDRVNPHFKSSYADLASVWNACREPLSKNGLAIIQTAHAEGENVSVETMLTHKSGEWVSDVLNLPARGATPQQVGSLLTYLRRYSLSAMVGVAPEDDDAEAAQAPHRANGNGAQHQPPPRQFAQHPQERTPANGNQTQPAKAAAPAPAGKSLKQRYDDACDEICDRLGQVLGNKEIACIKEKHGGEKATADQKILIIQDLEAMLVVGSKAERAAHV